MDLSGKTALVTGSAKRLGQQLALELASHGVSVVIHYLSSRTNAMDMVDSLKDMGVKAMALKADLSDTQQAGALVPRALELTGSLDLLVNNASIFDPIPFPETSLDQWNRHLAINLTAPFILCKSFSELKPSESHRANYQRAILNMLDWRALRPTSSAFAYTISKAGLVAMTKSLAQTLAPDIRVNALALGPVIPSSWEGPEYSSELIEKIPAARQATLGEVRDSAMFLLAGPQFITGEVLHLDGGRNLV